MTKWVVRPTVVLVCLVPLLWLLGDTFTGNLSANPLEDITHRTGLAALRILIATLAVTPIVRVSGWSHLMKLRRMIGLFAFFYVTLHLATYLVFDQFFSLSGIVEDVARRPYITVGFAAFLILVPLAITSTKRMIKRLGGARWRALHSLVYVAAAAGVMHYLWLVKIDKRDPSIYGGILVVLLASRLWPKRVKHAS
ncbi:MAG: sulfoxide reductase heme-binding subunit YedZ [Gemmatimonadota bacterium]|nr:MAG: sulfoxide reductase heme-binding subunit YedZ [Gemmatimonadota bacterium]